MAGGVIPLRRLALDALAAVSVALCWLLVGQRMSLCAYAYAHRDRPAWRLWVTVWDWLLAWAEDRHCERAAGRW